MDTAGYHKSVLLNEAVKALDIEAGKWYLDCTLGDGGHTLAILKLGGRVIGLDVDPKAIERSKGRLEKSGILVALQGNFRDVKNLIQPVLFKKQGEQTDTTKFEIAGAIFDLGVSSLQLETPGRGFSFAKTGPIDMRMDPGLQVTAQDLLKILTRKELYELFYKLGEEKYAWRLADAVDRARQVKPLVSTVELAEIISRAVREGRGKIHPATKVFQALRIAVNDELGALAEGLEAVKDLVKGQIVVISFHSLEDRVVKNTFKRWAQQGFGQIITKKPIEPKDIEISQNPRARSAKMRVFMTEII